MLLGLFAFEAQVFGNEQGLKARYSSPETRLFLGRNGSGGLARPAASEEKRSRFLRPTRALMTPRARLTDVRNDSWFRLIAGLQLLIPTARLMGTALDIQTGVSNQQALDR